MRQYGRIIAAAAAVIVILGLALAVPYLNADSSAKALTEDAATQSLRAIIPDIKLLSLEPAQIEGLYEVTFETQGERGVAYLDREARKIVIGSIIDIATKQNFTREKMESLNKVNFSQIPLDDSIVLGDAKAKHKVVVFDDPD